MSLKRSCYRRPAACFRVAVADPQETQDSLLNGPPRKRASVRHTEVQGQGTVWQRANGYNHLISDTRFPGPPVRRPGPSRAALRISEHTSTYCQRARAPMNDFRCGRPDPQREKVWGPKVQRHSPDRLLRQKIVL